MKKIITLGALVLATVFLSGCSQQQAGQVQPAAPSSAVTPQPTQPVANEQPVAQPAPQPSDDTNWKTYVDTSAGFQLTMPDSWKGYQAQDKALTDTIDICFMFDQHGQHCIFSLTGVPLSEKGHVSLYDNSCIVGETNSSIIVSNDCCKGAASTGTSDNIDAFENARCAEVPTILKTFKAAN